jgi:hypothetical protein
MIPENAVFATKTCVTEDVIESRSSPIIRQIRGVEEQKCEPYVVATVIFCATKTMKKLTD